MNSDINILLGLYFSTSGASIVMNMYLYHKNHIIAKKESYRKLKYKDGLYYKTKRQLREINYEHFFDMMDGVVNSLIPFKNVYFTYENIMFENEFDDLTSEVYDEIIKKANDIEDEYRKTNVDMLRSIRSNLSVIPNSLDLDDENIRLNKKETKKVLKLNHLNYDLEMLKFEKDNNLV